MMSPPAGFARPTGHPATRATQARERGARPGSPANRARAWPRLEIVRSESAEESPQLHRQLARLATPGDDDARMPPTGLEPLAVEAFAVGPVERHEESGLHRWQRGVAAHSGSVLRVVVAGPRLAGGSRPYPHRRSEASRAPWTSASNLAHITVGCWRWNRAPWAKLRVPGEREHPDRSNVNAWIGAT